jgi:hypothetical protein
MSSKKERSTREKLNLFKRFFTGRKDVYGTYHPKTGNVHQVKKLVTDKVMLHHLQGKRPYGCFLLQGDTTGAVALDFDDLDLLPPIEFVRAAGNYALPAYIERSKSKGYHVWVFFEEGGAPAAQARAVAHHILDEIGCPDTEVFPKHDHLDRSTRYGNFINAPLFGKLVAEGRTVFLQPEDYTDPCPDQWEFLEGIERVGSEQLDEIIEINDVSTGKSPPPKAGTSPSNLGRTLGLPPCAQKMLQQGVSENQRVSCFRLAVHLKKAGLPRELAIAALRCWAQKNSPTNGKRIIIDSEIQSQTEYAYENGYRGCGCEDAHIHRYCDSSCRLHGVQHNGAETRSTTP